MLLPGILSPDTDNFRVKFLDITPPQISDGTAVGYASVDPRNEVVYEQSSWHQGAGLDLIREDDESKNRYAVGNGVVSIESGGKYLSGTTLATNMCRRSRGTYAYDQG